ESRRGPTSDAASTLPKRWWVLDRCRCRGPLRSLYQNDGEKVRPKIFFEAQDKIARGQARQRKAGGQACGGGCRGRARRAAAVDNGADRRGVPPLQGGKS